jgi:hypothetical protein
MGSDQVLHKTTEAAQSGIIKWHGFRSLRVFPGHGLYSIMIDVM